MAIVAVSHTYMDQLQVRWKNVGFFLGVGGQHGLYSMWRHHTTQKLKPMGLGSTMLYKPFTLLTF
jgi:hypothetical protein